VNFVELNFVELNRLGSKEPALYKSDATMPRSQRNDNFIDKSFTVMADLLLKILPTNRRSKEAFVYYRDGMSAQAEGEYAEALENYEEALTLEDDPNDRCYILYNMGLIHASNGDHETAIDLYEKALADNPRLPQALNNLAVIYHYQGEKLKEEGNPDEGESLLDKAAEYWKQAIRLAPNNYVEAQNWLKTSGRSDIDIFF
jgi:tetratricopeptide (TPR) repeat protein